MVVRSTSTRARRAITADEFAAMQAAGIALDAHWHDDDLWHSDGSPYRFSVTQYHRLIDLAILAEADRVELIRGEILNAMAMGTRHAGCVTRINRVFHQRFAALATIASQSPIVLTTSEPEPDVLLLVQRPDDYTTGKPRPGDLHLVVEVADTSLVSDLGDKATLYAEAMIPEYWVVDLLNDVVHVHTSPCADGSWGTVIAHGRGESIAAPLGVTISIDEMLP
jgi:Uma2 family endonuclease